ncbi:hypothetical protein ACLOJK_028044 [Asimina triloba]
MAAFQGGVPALRNLAQDQRFDHRRSTNPRPEDRKSLLPINSPLGAGNQSDERVFPSLELLRFRNPRPRVYYSGESEIEIEIEIEIRRPQLLNPHPLYLGGIRWEDFDYPVLESKEIEELMSRCFPYTPPNYVKKVSDAALIESIKKETERAEKERKKLKKQEKKEKKKERQEKGKHRPREDRETQEKNDYGDKKNEKESVSLFHKNVGDSKKGVDQDTEQLERSSISEEHGQAVSIQCVHDSFDSMHGSVKRKRPETPTNACHSHIGNMLLVGLVLLLSFHWPLTFIIKSLLSTKGGSLRIRLSLSKQKDSGLQCGEPKPCTSGRAEIPSRERPAVVARKGSNVASKMPAKEPLRAVKGLSIAAKMPAKEPLKAVRELSSAAKIPAKEPFKAVKEHSSKAKIPDSVATARFPANKLPAVARECRNAEDLMGSWRPLPPLQMEHGEHGGAAEAAVKVATKELPMVVAREYANAEDLMDSWEPMQLQMEHPDMDDLDWLFEGRQQRSEPDAKRQKGDSCSIDLICSSTTLGPRACYLPAADIYALPYVLPF